MSSNAGGLEPTLSSEMEFGKLPMDKSTMERLKQLRSSKEYNMEADRLVLETDYVKKHFGELLPRCLAEVLEKRPHDPIEYIAHWMYKDRENSILDRQAKLDQYQLMKEKQQKATEEELLALGRPQTPEPPEGSVHRLTSSHQQVVSEQQMPAELSQQEISAQQHQLPSVHSNSQSVISGDSK